MELKTPKNFIVVAGNIGSGKTTLTKMLGDRLNYETFFESVNDNPYLEDFYKDMKTWSFPLQVYFLTHRFNAHKNIQEHSASCIQDRSIYEDAHIFARLLFEKGDMSARDYENYLRLYQSLTPLLEAPDLLIFLDRSLPRLVERIKSRGREFEKNIDSYYLGKLGDYYRDWFHTYDSGKRLYVNTDDLDFLENPNHFEKLVEKIQLLIGQQSFHFELQ